jgi:hypothetical protein
MPAPVTLRAVMPKAPAPTATMFSDTDMANAIALERNFFAADLIMGKF